MKTLIELDLPCHVVQNNKQNFLILMDDCPFDFTIKLLKKGISLTIQSGISWHKYSANFTFENFEKINKKFSYLKNLQEIHEFILKKIYQEELLIIEEGLLLSINFDLDLAKKEKEKIKIDLPINSDWGNGPSQRDLSRTIIKLCEKIKKLEGKVSENDNKNISPDESLSITSDVSSCFSLDKNESNNNDCDYTNTNMRNDKIIQTEKIFTEKKDVVLLEKSSSTNTNIISENFDINDNDNYIEKNNFEIIENISIKNDIDNINNYPTKIDSIVLNNKDKKFIESCFDFKFELKLLYRGTKDGKKSTNFHEFCDNKGPTICIILTEDGYKFGGFTNLNWENKLGYKKNDPNAFLFSLNKQKKYECNCEYVIYCNPEASVVFGNGHDICISNNWDEKTYSNFPFSFGNKKSVWLNEMVPRKFKPIEVEVFALKKI